MHALNPSNLPHFHASHAAKSSAGFGLGLRTQHYADFLAGPQAVDWLEIITDNFLVEGGKPLVMLDTIRRDYPVAMHGVAMSIGAAGGVDVDYLRRIKALADRMEPMWVSDHLCWTGPGPEQLHDLYPMPYTDEAARHVVEQIQRAQDVLQRQLVLENVSSYIDFKHNSASEWQFLAHIAEAADCLLLVDVNNIYVSSVNHRFDPQDYLNALPAHRVRQMHLAGHSNCGDYIVDTHDHPVAPAVWNLYAKACKRFGPVATMIERDDHIPPLQTLIDELRIARGIAGVVFAAPADEGATTGVAHAYAHDRAQTQLHAATPMPKQTDAPAPALRQVQRSIADYILDRPGSTVSPLGTHTTANAGAQPHRLGAGVVDLVRAQAGVDSAQRLGIYHNAYRARLVEVLADSFSKTYWYMGSDTFEHDATAFVVSHPPLTRSLSRYGADFPAHLATLYPDNPELHELAQLDWDLRTRFDGADVAALSPQTAQAGDDAQAPPWLSWREPLHPSLTLRSITTNVMHIWRAIDADAEVPPVQQLAETKFLAVWRKGLQPHFQSLDADEAAFLQSLLAGHSVDETANALAGTDVLPDPQRLGGWLQSWLADGVLRLHSAQQVSAAHGYPNGVSC